MDHWTTPEKLESSKLIPTQHPPPPVQSRKHRLLQKTQRLVVCSGITTVGIWALIGYSTNWTGPTCHRPGRALDENRGRNFRWMNVTPSADLVYHPCWDDFECARLEVPLDWENPENGLKAAVAIVKLPAKVDEKSEEWGGPVLINPGGPGGSGVETVLAAGHKIQTILGPQFSILGFDPRGVNNTTPPASCFPSPTARQIWGFKSGGRILGSSESGEEIGEIYARSKVVGDICESVIGGEGGAGRYVGTAMVARDMLEITERAWKRVGRKGEERGIRYWGFSYGSVLGSTFAAMFPDRVERLLVDGVCDVEDYFKTGWRTNLQDAEKVMFSFYSYCSLAGPLRCPFHTGTTPEDISARLAAILVQLKRQPLPVPGAAIGGEIITYSDVKTMMFLSLYKPLTSFPKMAKVLVDIENGDGESMVAYQKQGFECVCTPDEQPTSGFDLGWAILCSDGEVVEDTLEDVREYLNELTKQSETTGGSWASIRVGCVGWKIRPQGLMYNGPFTANTSWPLLFIGNSADPVTPVRNAWKMAKGYEGAVVLEQNSEGHCSISTPSVCTAKYIREYFTSGTLPPKDTVCDVDVKPFFGEDSMFRVMSEDDRELYEAVADMGRNWKIPRLGL